MDVNRAVTDQIAEGISCGTHLLAHCLVLPIWPIGSSKPDGNVGIINLHAIDVRRYFPYPGIESTLGGNHQSVKRPTS